MVDVPTSMESDSAIDIDSTGGGPPVQTPDGFPNEGSVRGSWPRGPRRAQSRGATFRPMRYPYLGRSALRVSRLGLGCFNFGAVTDEPTAFAIMDRALEAGINLFDTADIYANSESESIIGRWLPGWKPSGEDRLGNQGLQRIQPLAPSLRAFGSAHRPSV